MKIIEKVIESRSYLLGMQKEKLLEDLEEEGILESHVIRELIKEVFRQLLDINIEDFSAGEGVILNRIINEFSQPD